MFCSVILFSPDSATEIMTAELLAGLEYFFVQWVQEVVWNSCFIFSGSGVSIGLQMILDDIILYLIPLIVNIYLR